ncbi:MAG: hypothetical protein K2Y30_02040 [Flavobacteriaceae bacterium]|nr:hypothetical protein [Flavobacteriaceae bacterium]
MTTEKLNQLFDAALDNEIKVADLEGITKDKIYNWRKGRNTHKVSTGDKLNLLWQLGKINITVNKSTVDYIIPDAIQKDLINSVIDDIIDEPN